MDALHHHQSKAFDWWWCCASKRLYPLLKDQNHPSSVFTAYSNSLTYIVNGMLRVFNFTCVKSILLEVHDVWLRRISFSLSSIFWKKKEKENWNKERVGTLNFFAEFQVRDHPVSLQSNPRHSSNSTRQKVLEYRRRRQSIQSGSTAFASKHDELSADKKSRAIRAGLPKGLLARASSKTARSCKKQSVWASSVSAWHLDRGPCASTEDTPPLLSLFRSPSPNRQALQRALCVVRFVHDIYDYQQLPSMLSCLQNG